MSNMSMIRKGNYEISLHTLISREDLTQVTTIYMTRQDLTLHMQVTTIYINI